MCFFFHLENETRKIRVHTLLYYYNIWFLMCLTRFACCFCVGGVRESCSSYLSCCISNHWININFTQNVNKAYFFFYRFFLFIFIFSMKLFAAQQATLLFDSYTYLYVYVSCFLFVFFFCVALWHATVQCV